MSRRPLAALFALLPFAIASAQDGSSAASPVQQAAVAQQAAVSSGDTATILSTSRHLAAVALLFSGLLYLADHENGKAIAALNQSLAAEPLPQTEAELVTANLLAGKPGDATKAEEAALATLGDQANTRMLLAEACFSADDLACTVSELRKALALDPSSAAAHLALGGAYWQLNEYQYNQDSLDQFSAAQKLDPGSFASNFELGSVLSQYQRYTEAEPFLRRAATADPGSPDPWLQLGMNRFAEGNYAEARPLLTKAVELTGSDIARNNYQVRRAFAELSRIAASEQESAEAAAWDARDADVRRTMTAAGAAPVLSQSTGLINNSTSQGFADKRTAPASPQNAQTELSLAELATQSMNDAGTALARTQDYEGALTYFRIAARIRPEQPPTLRNLGIAAFHAGKLAEAAAALRPWTAAHPGDALAVRYLQQSTTLAQP